MKILNLAFLFLTFLFVGCDLEPLPLEIPKDSFELSFSANGYSSTKLIDGVQLSNGDFIVVGTTKKNGLGDAYIARFDKEGKQILKDTIIDSGGDEEISSIAIDNNEDVYIAGNSNTMGLLIKLSTKGKDISKIWNKAQYGTLPFNGWFSNVFFVNNQIFTLEGVKSGNSPGSFVGIRKMDIDGNSTGSTCSNSSKIESFITKDATVFNNKLYACGHGNNSCGYTIQASWDLNNICSTPIKRCYSFTDFSDVPSTNFHAAWSIIATSTFNYLLVSDQKNDKLPLPSKDIWKPIFNTTNNGNLNLDGLQKSIFEPNIPNLISYQGAEMCLSADGMALIFAGNFKIGDNKSYTDLRRRGGFPLLGDSGWTQKSYNLYSEQIILTKDGGYLLIGNLNENIGKVVKTNASGDCSSCK